MALDIETGEVSNVSELMVKAIERRQRRWAEHIKAGLARVQIWKVDNPRRRISPTRFYKLMHEQNSL